MTGRMARGFINDLYAAALDPDRWPDLLVDLSGWVDGAAPHVYVLKNGRLAYQLSVPNKSADCTPGDEVSGDQLSSDLTVNRGLALADETVFSTGQLLSTEELRLAQSNGLLNAGGFGEMMAFHCRLDGDYQAVVCVYRGRGAKRFSQANKARWHSFAGPIKRALLIQHRWLLREQPFTADVLEKLQMNVLVVTERGQILFANQCARIMLQQRDGFYDDDDWLRAVLPSEAEKFRQLLNASAAPDASSKVARASGKAAYNVTATPLALPSHWFFSVPRWLVIVNDPARRVELAYEELIRRYCLTPSEARLTTALLEGKSLMAYAEAAGITQNTARWTLKQVFAKTETRRQSALILKLINGLSA